MDIDNRVETNNVIEQLRALDDRIAQKLKCKL